MTEMGEIAKRLDLKAPSDDELKRLYAEMIEYVDALVEQGKKHGTEYSILHQLLCVLHELVLIRPIIKTVVGVTDRPELADRMRDLMQEALS